MSESTTVGMNRTGIVMSPKASKDTIEFAQSRPPSSEGDVRVEAAVLTEYVRVAEPAGKVPPPGSVRGAGKMLMQKLAGNNAEILLDKLGERLAFERGGVRLYDALIAKCRGADVSIPMFDLEVLAKIRNDELDHFKMLSECIAQLGADPTAMTPSANVAGVESMGLMQVLNDPRMSVGQSLHAILVAELADNAAWEALIGLAGQLDLTEFVDRFETALEQEESHLLAIKQWANESVLMQVRR